ncbi:MAG: protocatechuate 3,4-dioxygenase beta subunit [Arenicella sp.]|jgi:protocatechuate 3,4-dioxygenase beta subunit
MDRKEFIKKVGLGSVSFALVACGTSQMLGEAEDCKLTHVDDRGPFYFKGSSQTLNLNYTKLPGEPMMVSGTVFSGESSITPLAGVKIDIWHCDSAGNYHPNDGGKITSSNTKEMALRGFVITDARGKYSFKSIFPGFYARRSRHIHYILSAPGHQELTTQNYFQGDDRIPHDTLSQSAGDCRIIHFKKNNEGAYTGTMNFNLETK